MSESVDLSEPFPFDEDSEEGSIELRGVAERLQQAISDVFSEQSNDVGPSQTPVEIQPIEALKSAQGGDRRLYCPDADGWALHVKTGAREYCHLRHPGEEYFHLLLEGEVYLQHGEIRLCLNCALRKGVLTDDRLFWQTGRRAMTQEHRTLDNTTPELDDDERSQA